MADQLKMIFLIIIFQDHISPSTKEWLQMERIKVETTSQNIMIANNMPTQITETILNSKKLYISQFSEKNSIPIINSI
jgi:hypothetical protein